MNLQTRVVNILTRPASEWPVIAAEPSDVAGLYKNYIALLAAIPAVCTFLGLMVVGVPFVGSYGFSAALVAGIMSYVSALASVYIAALIIEKLAPNFDSRAIRRRRSSWSRMRRRRSGLRACSISFRCSASWGCSPLCTPFIFSIWA